MPVPTMPVKGSTSSHKYTTFTAHTVMGNCAAHTRTRRSNTPAASITRVKLSLNTPAAVLVIIFLIRGVLWMRRQPIYSEQYSKEVTMALKI